MKHPYLPTVHTGNTRSKSYSILENQVSMINLANEIVKELWYQRLVLPGKQVMQYLPACIDSFSHTIKGHPFHHCKSCDKTKIKNQQDQQ